MTLALIAILVLAAFGQLAAGGFEWNLGDIASNPVNWALGAKTPSLVSHGEYWRLATASFLHGSWVPHLAANLFSLLVLGLLIEHYYGASRMLAIFLFSCITGTVASHFFTASTSLGASTGVMGLLGALLIHNYRYRRYLPERLNGIYPLLIAMLFVQLTMDVLSRGVDIAGHIGGVLGGAVMAGLLRGRLAGPGRGSRDYLPLPVALALTLGFMGYGVYGLATALPREDALLRAGRAQSLRAQAAAMSEAVERRPYFLEAQFYLVEILLELGELDDATRRMEALLKANPDVAEGRRGRRLRRYLVEYYRMRANVAFSRGRWAEAVENYGRLLELETEPQAKAEAHNGYAWTLADKLGQRLEEAERHALQATRIAPDNTAYVDTLAWVYYKQGRLMEALEQQRRAVMLMEQEGRSLPDTRAEMYYHLGAIQEKLGREEEALTSYRRAVGSIPGYPPALEGLRRLVAPAPTPPPPAATPARPSPALDPAVTQGIL